MADPKYIACNIGLNIEQKALIERAAQAFYDETGVKLTRSQCLAMLAKRYLDTQSLTPPRSARAYIQESPK